MKMPTQEQIDVAVMWLQSNEGEGYEGAACRAVADWLDWQAHEKYLRLRAREIGVPVARLRKKLAEHVSAD